MLLGTVASNCYLFEYVLILLKVVSRKKLMSIWVCRVPRITLWVIFENSLKIARDFRSMKIERISQISQVVKIINCPSSYAITHLLFDWKDFLSYVRNKWEILVDCVTCCNIRWVIQAKVQSWSCVFTVQSAGWTNQDSSYFTVNQLIVHWTRTSCLFSPSL